MDELLRDFLTETVESLDSVDAQLVQLEREPNNRQVLANIFRLVHTIKGTCGFLGLPRLEALAHAAESLMGKFRDGMPITSEVVTLILATIDRVKTILDGLEKLHCEPLGDDADLIAQLGRIAGQVHETHPAHQQHSRGSASKQRPAAQTSPETVDSTNTERPVVETPGSLANQSIRVSIDTLDQLMTMVSELVLTRNQLLEILRKHNDSDFKVALQRLSNLTTDVQQGVDEIIDIVADKLDIKLTQNCRTWTVSPSVAVDATAPASNQTDLLELAVWSDLTKAKPRRSAGVWILKRVRP